MEEDRDVPESIAEVLREEKYQVFIAQNGADVVWAPEGRGDSAASIHPRPAASLHRSCPLQRERCTAPSVRSSGESRTICARGAPREHRRALCPWGADAGDLRAKRRWGRMAVGKCLRILASG